MVAVNLANTKRGAKLPYTNLATTKMEANFMGRQNEA